jgi:hypothetical protein
MPIILTLFFLSLSGIIYMIGSKLILLQNGEVVIQEHIPIKVPDLQEFKYIVTKNSKKYGFILLVIILRASIKSSYFLKKKYKEIKYIAIIKIKKILTGKKHGIQEHEVSSFLKKVSDYKSKVNKIKNQIKEEEGIN